MVGFDDDGMVDARLGGVGWWVDGGVLRASLVFGFLAFLFGANAALIFFFHKNLSHNPSNPPPIRR